MKSLEELQLTTTDLAAVLPKVIIDRVETAARAVRYGRNVCRLNRDLVGKPGRSIYIPVRGAITAAKVSEGATPSISKAAYSTVQVTPFKLGIGVKITQEAIDGSEMDVIRDHLDEAGEGIADAEDKEIIYELLGRNVVTDETHASTQNTGNEVFTMDHKPILKVVAVDTGAGSMTVSAVDYYDGKIKVTDAVDTGTDIYFDYEYSSRTAYVDASTAGQVAEVDLRASRNKIRVAKFKPDRFWVYEDEADDILGIERFTEPAKYGPEAAPLMTGEIGRIFGCTVLASQNFYPGIVACFDSSRAMYLVMKRDLDLKRKDAPDTDSIELYFYMELAPKCIQDTAVALVVNCASDANKGL